jgi:hypothetical protein
MAKKKEKSIWGERLTTAIYIVMVIFVVSYLYQAGLSYFVG